LLSRLVVSAATISNRVPQTRRPVTRGGNAHARAIGTLAVAGGNTVEVIGRDQSKSADLAKALGGSVTTAEFGAVPAGDIVILALRYADVVPVVTKYGDALAGKVIVDISNPFNSAADGLAIPDDTSIAQQVAKAAPASATVVKAFNTVFGHVLKEGRMLDVFFAGEDARPRLACRSSSRASDCARWMSAA
jgi:predicted dinucleotide-binding enzyme